MSSINIANKYRWPPQAPPVFNYTSSSVHELAQSIIAKSHSLLENISTTITEETATFENVVEAIARNYDYASVDTRIIHFYPKVSSNKELREACRKADDELDKYDIESSMREDIFKLIDGLHDKRDVLEIGPESLRLLKRMHRQCILEGLGLPDGCSRSRLKDIRQRLDTIRSEYRKNLGEEGGCVWLTRDELAGVPADVVSTLEDGAGSNQGKLRLTLKYPHVRPTLQYATSPDVRKLVWIANENKVRYH